MSSLNGKARSFWRILTAPRTVKGLQSFSAPTFFHCLAFGPQFVSRRPKIQCAIGTHDKCASSLGRYVFGSEISYNKAPPRLPGLGC